MAAVINKQLGDKLSIKVVAAASLTDGIWCRIRR